MFTYQLTLTPRMKGYWKRISIPLQMPKGMPQSYTCTYMLNYVLVVYLGITCRSFLLIELFIIFELYYVKY